MNPNKQQSMTDKFTELRSTLKDPATGAFPPVISVVSAARGEGKTTVAANLAKSLARQGQRVAIVDLNFRSPGLSTFFTRPNSAGLSDVLQGKAEMNDVLCDIDGIHIIFNNTSGETDVLDLLESPRMRDLLQLLTQEFAVVILDTPALGDFRDGIIASQYADFVLYVLASGTVSSTRIKGCLNQLGPRRIGVVLNRDRG
jgi:capsular exopolysaccharide synthesis family protein